MSKVETLELYLYTPAEVAKEKAGDMEKILNDFVDGELVPSLPGEPIRMGTNITQGSLIIQVMVWLGSGAGGWGLKRILDAVWNRTKKLTSREPLSQEPNTTETIVLPGQDAQKHPTTAVDSSTALLKRLIADLEPLTPGQPIFLSVSNIKSNGSVESVFVNSAQGRLEIDFIRFENQDDLLKIRKQYSGEEKLL